jgi:hypothetical protein
VPAQASGEFRRTTLERSDQRVSWERPDQAFFASGACHILAWECRDLHRGHPLGIAAIRFADEERAFHVYATWQGWAFDHAGWNAETDLLTVNTEFEGRAIERIGITTGLAEFCARHYCRMPEQYWRDPVPRARAYAGRHRPPWDAGQASSSPRR